MNILYMCSFLSIASLLIDFPFMNDSAKHLLICGSYTSAGAQSTGYCEHDYGDDHGGAVISM